MSDDLEQDIQALREFGLICAETQRAMAEVVEQARADLIEKKDCPE